MVGRETENDRAERREIKQNSVCQKRISKPERLLAHQYLFLFDKAHSTESQRVSITRDYLRDNAFSREK